MQKHKVEKERECPLINIWWIYIHERSHCWPFKTRTLFFTGLDGVSEVVLDSDEPFKQFRSFSQISRTN
jgi:hypothetical protein